MVSLALHRLKLRLAALRTDTLQAKAMRNAGISLSVRMASIAAGFLAQLVLARVLGVSEFGLYAYTWSWMLVLAILGKAGGDIAAVRYVAAYRASQDMARLKGYIHFAIITCLGVSIVAACSVGLLLGRLSAYVNIAPTVAEGLVAMLYVLPIYALAMVQTGILRGVERIFEALLTQNLLLQLGILLFIGLHYSLNASTPTAITAIWASGIAALATTAVQMVIIAKHTPILDRNVRAAYALKEWLTVSATIMTSTGLYQLFGQLDVLAVGTFLGTSVAGLYSVALRFTRLVMTGLEIANQSTAHMFPGLYQRGETRKLQQIVRLNASMSILYTLPPAFILFVWPTHILALFGESFVDGATLLRILLVAQMVGVISGPNGILLNLTGHERELAMILGMTLIVFVTMLAMLIPTKGAIGAAVATLIAYSIHNFASSLRVWQRLRINPTAIALTLKATISPPHIHMLPFMNSCE